MPSSASGKHLNNWDLIPAWLLIAALFLVCSVISFAVMAEDAYISFRYAENVAQGWGPVFNQGAEEVEGYSNPLWVLILALANSLGLDSGNASRCLGLLFGALALLEIMLLVGNASGGSRKAAFAAGAILATAPPFLFWSQAGLETSLFLYLLVLGLRLFLREREQAGRWPISAVFLLLVALTRPEGIMYSVILGAYLFVQDWKRPWKEGKSRLLLWALIIAIPFVVFIMWRHQVFDAWVPNTFFAKVNNGLRHKARVGFRYLIWYLNHSFWLPVLVPALAGFLSRGIASRATLRALQILGALAAVQILFLLYVGGDIHPYDRFCLPLLLLAVPASYLLVSGSEGLRSGRAIAWMTIVFLAGNLAYWFPPAARMEPPMRFSPNLLTANLAGLVTGRTTLSSIREGYAGPRQDGLDLVGHDLARDPLVQGVLATDQCGKIPYWSGLDTVDLFGLNDPEIAQIIHSNQTWDRYAEEILARSPDIFVVFYRDGHLVSDYYLENALLSAPARERYSLDAIYHIDYSFFDVLGREHAFSHELLRFRVTIPDRENRAALTEADRRWLLENQPIVDTPDLLRELVEAFRQGHKNDPKKVIRFHVSLN